MDHQFHNNQQTNQHYQQNYQPPHHPQYPPNYYPPQPVKKPFNAKSVVAFVCGILAMTLPIPIADVALGIIGLVFAIIAKKEGAGGLATAGLVLSIIGTVVAAMYTVEALTFGWSFGFGGSPWGNPWGTSPWF